jgi:hypothetical protein
MRLGLLPEKIVIIGLQLLSADRPNENLQPRPLIVPQPRFRAVHPEPDVGFQPE